MKYKIPKYAIVRSIDNEENQVMKVNKSEVMKTVNKSMNYLPLNIKIRKLKLKKEEETNIYKDVVTQFSTIKKLIENDAKYLELNKIDFKKLENKVNEIEQKRGYKYEL